MPLGTATRKIRTEADIEKQSDRLKLLRRAIIAFGGPTRLGRVSGLKLRLIRAWSEGSRWISDEDAHTLESLITQKP